jgi:hypothetical protein
MIFARSSTVLPVDTFGTCLCRQSKSITPRNLPRLARLAAEALIRDGSGTAHELTAAQAQVASHIRAARPTRWCFALRGKPPFTGHGLK